MRTTRRAFLKLSAMMAALVAGVRPSSAATTAPEIHRATRNTVLGAIGAGLRRFRSPLTPYKRYPDARQVELPPVGGVTGVALATAVERAGGRARVEASGDAVSRDTLARLLYLANGDTGRSDGNPYRLRAAPSAGALYAGELYVLARDVAGLEPGVWYYDVGRHALVRVRDDTGLPDSTFESAGAAGAAALVCISNVFERYGLRYANRGYRYALIDTGHIAENLRLAATSAGVTVASLRRFHDDALNTALGIDGLEEAVCDVHALGPQPLSAGTDTPEVRLVEQGSAKASRAKDTTSRYHEATKLVPAASNAPRRKRQNAVPTAANASTGKRVALPEDAPAARKPVETCIGERRSPRRFATTTIPWSTLAGVLANMLPSSAAAAAPAVDLHVFAHRVDGLQAGLYRYRPAEQALDALATGDFSERLEDACLGQDKAREAAAGLVMVGDLREASRDGERGYRDLLLACGEIAERAYLAAEGLDISARNLAAFLDDDLNDLIGVDGEHRAAVHLTMLGRAA